MPFRSLALLSHRLGVGGLSPVTFRVSSIAPATKGWLMAFPHNFYQRSGPLFLKPSAGWRRPFSTKSSDEDGDDGVFGQDVTALEDHFWLLEEYRLSSLQDNLNVMVIQPFYRTGQFSRTKTKIDYMMQESVGLVETLGWTVLDQVVVAVEETARCKHFLGSGQVDNLKDRIKALEKPKEDEGAVQSGVPVSALFLSTFKLTALQRLNLEEGLGRPVLDRHNIVLQIFKRHAQTREAKLQVRLAEIPYLRARLFGDYEMEQLNKHDSSKRKGEIYFSTKRMSLARRERKLKEDIEKLRLHRQRIRKNRIQCLKIPTVAVVGYTNAGKTSLIKAITGDDRLKPDDRLFATLDMTVHSGRLPGNLQMLFMDTIGFISDIPTDLITSFESTLEDVKVADVLLHVRDVSNPDHVDQNSNVIATLERLDIYPSSGLVITVGNKIDQLDPKDWIHIKDDGMIPISCLYGYGVEYLKRKIEKALIEATGRKEFLFRFSIDSLHGNDYFEWLKQNVVVRGLEVDETRGQYLVKTLVRDYDLNRFRKHFLGKMSAIQE